MSKRVDEQSQIDGVNNRQPKGGFPFFRAAFFVLVLFFVIIPFTSIPKKLKDGLKEIRGGRTVVKEKIVYVDRPVESKLKGNTPDRPTQPRPPVTLPKPKPPKPPKPAPPVEPVLTPNYTEHAAYSGGDVRKLSKDIDFKTHVEVKKGGIASKERKDRKAYEIEYNISVKLPKPAQTPDELMAMNSEVFKILPGLEKMLPDAKVSPYFYSIYKNKVERIKANATNLNTIVTRHNFFDCETILNMKHEGGRKVMFMQADMDVVSDGSDGDRLPEMPDKIVNSTHYQPFTSYGWKKATKTPNPMVAGWEKRIGNANREIADPKTSADRKAWLRDRIKMLKRGIADMKARSFLVAEYDPFIVMPVDMLTNMSDKYAPKAGDYAVVIYNGKIYPAIVGDAGPNRKVGEASLRMAKQLNSAAGIYSRPVSDLKVTYLVFPFSRDAKKSAPDYAKWRKKCSDLLEEVGGLGEGYELFEWENIFPKKEEETQEP